MSLASNLIRIRKKNRMSQAAVARAAGISQQSLSRLENGIDLTSKYLPAIADALETDVSDLDPSYASKEPGAAIQVPILDYVTAGRLKSPMSQIIVGDLPTMAISDLGRGDWFALRVQGDSMDRISPDGAIIIVNKADRELKAGKFYVFSVDGETTYKMWQEGDPPMLAPFSLNPKNQTIVVKKRGFDVIGRVRRTIFDL